MKVHLVPVGTSMYKTVQKHEFPLLPDSIGLEGNGSPTSDEIAVRLVEEGVLGKFYDSVNDYLGLLKYPDSGVAASSAELQSLFSVTETGNDTEGADPARFARVTSEDHVVLIASDTPEGLESALCVAAAIHRVTLCVDRDSNVGARWTFISDPGAGVPELDRDGITIIRVPGLRASERARFIKCMEALGSLFGKIHTRALGTVDTAVVHLTGGYKASIPFLVTFAEGMKCLAIEGRETTEAHHLNYAVHAVICHLDEGTDEEKEKSTKAEPIEVPLRHFGLAAWEGCVKGVRDKDACELEVNYSQFEGVVYFYDSSGSPYLTDAGLGLENMLIGAGKIEAAGEQV